MERAIETFVRGYCFTRSFTHPYVAGKAGPLWVLRDGPRIWGKTHPSDPTSHSMVNCRWAG